jgi:hypothetical protein
VLDRLLIEYIIKLLLIIDYLYLYFVKILRATGKPYHAQCFCCVACSKSLDGNPFTVDATMQIHCIDCFHQKFAPRCYACHRPILPTIGQEETIRIVALDRSYHIDCYRCEVSVEFSKKFIF